MTASINFTSGTVVTTAWANAIDGFVFDRFAWVDAYGAVGDGITDDTTAFEEASAASDFILLSPGKTYLVDAGGYPTKRAVIHKQDASSVIISGYGATIKFKNSATGPAGLNFIEVEDCNNVIIEGVTFDGNSSNQSYGYHAVSLLGGNHITVRDVVCNNMYYDGIYIRASTPATFSTYPTNVTLDNVITDNCGRNGVSVISVNGLKVRGGVFSNTVGDPGAGIDIEPNASDVYGCRDIEIDGVTIRDNAGRGIVVTGNAAVSTDTPYCLNARLTNITASGNSAAQNASIGGCDIAVYHCPDFVLDGFNNPGQDIDPMDAGLIYIHNTAISVVLNSLTFREIQTPTTTKSLVYVDSSNNPARVINDLHAYNCTATVVNGGKYSDINTLHAENCTGEYGVLLGNTRGSLRDATMIASSLVQAYNASGTGIYTIDGLTTINPIGRALRLYVANSVIRNVSVRHTGTAATQAIWLESITNTNINNVEISDSGGYWATTSQAWLITQSSLSGNRLRDISPSPLSGVKTSYDPADLTDGSATSTTVTLLRADVGDACRVKTTISLAGIMAFASITSANTATVTYFNKTGGSVNLGSHDLTVEAIK